MNTKKFWCHYIGSDGNTPKRRNIELTDIHDVLPMVSNEGAKTPLWCEWDEDEKRYYLYVQLSALRRVSSSVKPPIWMP